jgi:hypothetical protein
MEAIADVWYSARSVALPKQSELVCGFGVKGVLVVYVAVPCQQHWHQVHAIRGVGMMA